jgi:hypothetical protein
MPAPDHVKIEPPQAIEFFVAAETPVSIKYKLWLQREGAWTAIGPETTSDAKSDLWVFLPPTPPGSVFAYWLGIWGKANHPWRARISVSQQSDSGASVTRASWTETGILSDLDNGLGVDTTEIIKVPLR